jgi:hypothetical protein
MMCASATAATCLQIDQGQEESNQLCGTAHGVLSCLAALLMPTLSTLTASASSSPFVSSTPKKAVSGYA